MCIYEGMGSHEISGINVELGARQFFICCMFSLIFLAGIVFFPNLLMDSRAFSEDIFLVVCCLVFVPWRCARSFARLHRQVVCSVNVEVAIM